MTWHKGLDSPTSSAQPEPLPHLLNHLPSGAAEFSAARKLCRAGIFPPSVESSHAERSESRAELGPLPLSCLVLVQWHQRIRELHRAGMFRLSPLGSFCPGMRGANAGLCGHIFKYNLLCEFSLLYSGQRKKLPPSLAGLWTLPMGDYLDQPLQSWIPPLGTILWGRGRKAHSGEIQNVRPSEAIVWDQDRVLSPFLGSETLLIYPPKPRTAELAPAEGTTDSTQTKPAASSPSAGPTRPVLLTPVAPP